MNDESNDRVRRSTSTRVNADVDCNTDTTIARYGGRPRGEISLRITELEREWDVERVLEVNASTLAFIGLALGVAVHLYWLALTAFVLRFLFQQGVQGWCPPLPILRRLGISTRGGIDREKYALPGCALAVQRAPARARRYD